MTIIISPQTDNLKVKVFPKAVFFMSNETYWDMFTKSGKISDYLAFCNGRTDIPRNEIKEFKNNASEYQSSDIKRTEYR